MGSDNDFIISQLIDQKGKYTQEFIISGKPVSICIFFSVKHFTKLIELGKQNSDYQQHFAQVVYDMYAETETEGVLTEQDFFTASEDELYKILLEILCQDENLNNEYDQIKCDNNFERFYKANINQFNKSMKSLSNTMRHNKTIIRNSKLNESIERQNRFFQNSKLHESIGRQAALLRNIQGSNIGALKNIASAINLQSESIAHRFSKLQSVQNTVTDFQYPIIKSVLESIPRINDFAQVFSPIFEIQNAFSNQLRSSVSILTETFSKIDFSMLSYHDEWSEKHDLLVTFGWFYLNELPEGIIDLLYEQKDSINQEEVDNIIVQHFRNERCIELKKIVKRWSSSPYFNSRKRIFHEALVNHSRRYYNTSTTLLTLHTEGVITDFLRFNLEPRHNCQKAIGDVKELVDATPTLSNTDRQIYYYVIDNILFGFSERFEHSNPDKASNKARHKIAHGHALEIETEVNSLKLFLYMNELYRLFTSLDAETQQS